MKIKLFAIVILLVSVLLVSFGNVITKSSASDVDLIDNNLPVSLTSAKCSSLDNQKVLEARFLNMLNHNYVYGDSFDYIEEIVNGSVIALLNLADEESDSYIAQNFVDDYILNFYGVENVNYSEINELLPKLDGYVYIIPRGFSSYNHKISSVKVNEDGSYTVVTDVEVTSHDGEVTSCKANTLFVKNEKSQFGFNIIKSEISEKCLVA